ncbi:hypothetical protein ACHAXS_013279 [Conticribra weissflogii]
MTKLSLMKRLVTTSHHKRHAKSLLRRHDGPTSDRFQDDDDDDDEDYSRDGDGDSTSSSFRDRFGGDIGANANGEDDSSLASSSCGTDASDNNKNNKSNKNWNSKSKSKNSKNSSSKNNIQNKNKTGNNQNSSGSNNKKKKTSKNFILRTINSASHHIANNLHHNHHGNGNGNGNGNPNHNGNGNNPGEDDGYESDNSAGSTRSTSSSFLRYQNQSRSKWKTRLTAKKPKVVLEKRGDGREVPVGSLWNPAAEGEEVPKNGGWPLLFDRIYTRQNQLRKKGDASDNDDDDEENDDENDEENDEDEEEEQEEEVNADDGNTEEGIEVVSSSSLPQDKDHDDDKDDNIDDNDDNHDNHDNDDDDDDFDVTYAYAYDDATLPPPRTPKRDNPSNLATSSPETTQESGIPTCEVPPPPNDSSHAAKENSSHLANESTPSRSKPPTKPTRSKSRSKPKSRPRTGTTHQDGDILTPLSIPRTIAYSLRSAIGDGSARQLHSKSLMERRVLRPNGCHLDCGYWSHRGKRSYMEDRFVVERLGAHPHKSEPIAWLGVFDGHGGAAASQFCSDWLSSYVRKNDRFPRDLPGAMAEAFAKLDGDFASSGRLDGSTACACAVVGTRKVICANAGDSRAIVVKRDGSFVSLSEDHKPGRLDETKRINALGGRVIYWGRWRVEGVLAVSRSIGDARLKPYVTAEPDVKEYDIGDDDLFLVIASDGIWDTMTSDLVAKFVLVNTCKIVDKSLKVDDTLLQWIARQVARRAKENGSSDNVSCIVANLKST